MGKKSDSETDDDTDKEMVQDLDPGDMIEGEVDERNLDIELAVDHEAEFERMVFRHRLDVAKLLFGKDGGYSLRKYKRIFKREMEENPEKYYIKGKDPDDEPVDPRDILYQRGEWEEEVRRKFSKTVEIPEGMSEE